MFNLLEYFGYKIYEVLVKLLPLKSAYALADFVGYVVFRLKHTEGYKRAVIMQDIYKNMIDVDTAKRFVCRSIQLFNRDLVDFFKSGRLNRYNIDSFVKIENLQYLDEAVKKGKGVVLASIHFGSWEMSGIALALKGYPVYGMIWSAGNKRTADLFKKIRSRKGVGAVEVIHLLRIIELLQKNMIVGIMLDINGGSKGISCSSWGYNLKLPRGPAVMHLKNGAELLVLAIMRNDQGGYNMYFEKPDLHGDEEEITVSAFNILKKYIEKDPVQWHWIKYFIDPVRDKNF